MPLPSGSHTLKMLALIEQWTGMEGCHVDNTGRYLFLMSFKMGLDATILYHCWRRPYTSFLSMCGLSVVVADVLMVFGMMTVWFLEPLRSPMSVCFLLAHYSAIFAALPLPMAGLGLLDYLIQDSCMTYLSGLCNSLRYSVLASLVWFLAVVYSLATVMSKPLEIEDSGGKKALVCEVQESKVITYFIVGLLVAVVCVLLPHYSMIPSWYKKANWLSEQRDRLCKIQRSDLLSNYAGHICKENSEEEGSLVETAQQLPSLWLSLTLGFTSIWFPYLIISASILFLGFGVPAYIVVNLVWLECTNSLLVGVVFWVKGNKFGQYSCLQDDVCSWRTYWHLSRGTYQFQQMPTATKCICTNMYKTHVHI